MEVLLFFATTLICAREGGCLLLGLKCLESTGRNIESLGQSPFGSFICVPQVHLVLVARTLLARTRSSPIHQNFETWQNTCFLVVGRASTLYKTLESSRNSSLDNMPLTTNVERKNPEYKVQFTYISMQLASSSSSQIALCTALQYRIRTPQAGRIVRFHWPKKRMSDERRYFWRKNVKRIERPSTVYFFLKILTFPG